MTENWHMSDRLAGLTIGEIRRLARKDAHSVLEKHWSPNRIPVDPVHIARELGATVFKATLLDDSWGMLVGGDDGPTIYLDRGQPRRRYRFSCAHEIGHLVDRRDDIIAGKALVEKRSDAGRGNAEEVYANEFAAALLMPEAEFRAAVESGEDDFDLAQRFDVSLSSAAYHRKVLGL